MTSSRLALACLILPTLLSLPAIAETQASYIVRLSRNWKIKANQPHITIWEDAANPTSHISAAFLSLPRSIAKRLTKRTPAALKSHSPIALDRLKPFLESRAAKMRKTGFQNWRATRAVEIAFSGGYKALQLQGTYTGASGAPLCFVERQINLSNQILQLTATEKKSGNCAWAKMAERLSEIEPTR